MDQSLLFVPFALLMLLIFVYILRELYGWSKKHRHSFQLEHTVIRISLSDVERSGQREVDPETTPAEEPNRSIQNDDESCRENLEPPDLPPTYDEVTSKRRTALF